MSDKAVERDFLLPIKLEIGDQVVTKGLANFPDDTKGTVVGFGTVAYGRTNVYGVEPGVYTDFYTAKVNLEIPNGPTGPFLVKITNLALRGDPADLAAREVTRRMVSNLPAAEAILLHREKIGELKPSYYEHDRIHTLFEGLGTIVRVEYNRDPVAYTVLMDETDQQRVVAGFNVGLERRGNVWKHEHGGILVFNSLLEEGNFFISSGDAQEIKNPATGDYSWTSNDVLRAIRDGDADGFTNDRVFGYIVYRYDDRELGGRIANLILSGHGLEGRFEVKEHKNAVQG
jgi:hypothetical protein